MKTPKKNTPYKLQGHIAATSFKSVFNGAYFIDGEWYVPKKADYINGEMEYGQPEDPEEEIGWDYDILPDDYVIDDYEEVDNNDKE